MGRKAIPQTRIDQRIRFEIMWEGAGLTHEQILNKVNQLAPKTGWGQISERQLRRDFAKNFAETGLVDDEDERNYFRRLQEKNLNRMEQNIFETESTLRTGTFYQSASEVSARKAFFSMTLQYDNALRKMLKSGTASVSPKTAQLLPPSNSMPVNDGNVLEETSETLVEAVTLETPIENVIVSEQENGEKVDAPCESPSLSDEEIHEILCAEAKALEEGNEIYQMQRLTEDLIEL